MENDEPELPVSERERALRQIKKRRDFQAHLVSFIVVNTAIWVVWAVTSRGYPWPAWITGLWGIGLLMNAWDVWGRRPITESDVQRELERLRPEH